MSRSQKCYGPQRVLILMAALVFGLALASSAEAVLTYTTPTDLKKTPCSGDSDGDCLDDVEEANLAWAVAPWYFYDEDESCSGWQNSYGLPAVHFARQDFFQVRPEGGAVQSWTPTDGKAKWVKVSYFFNHPHDCQSAAGFGGHQGDSEHIRVELYSYDLKTWYLYQAYYAHHDQDHYFSGSYLEDRALALGTSWISVAADADSHASWPGLDPDAAECAGPEASFCGENCKCFVGTWRDAFKGGKGRETVAVTRNIGGPAPEKWNPAVLTVSGSEAYTQLDVGHGLNREYWSPRSDAFQKFCGWECPAASRKPDGTCAVSVHDRTDCSSALSTKVDTSFFQLQAGSCSGHCGGSVAGCFCDAYCASHGDCCPDACAVCGQCGTLPNPYTEQTKDEAIFAPASPSDPAASKEAASAAAAVLPQLSGATAVQQLRTLRWMLASGDDRRLVFLFDDLREAREEPLDRRAAMARQRLEELALDLEKAGNSFSEPVEDAARVNPNAPSPNTFPPSVMESLGMNRDGSFKASSSPRP
jgi:hypothetical protein